MSVPASAILFIALFVLYYVWGRGRLQRPGRIKATIVLIALGVLSMFEAVTSPESSRESPREAYMKSMGSPATMADSQVAPEALPSMQLMMAPASVSVFPAAARSAAVGALAVGAAEPAIAQRRHLARKHQFTIEASHEQLPIAYTALMEGCTKYHCDVLESSITDGHGPLSLLRTATLTARIPVDQANLFMASLGTLGRLKVHQQETEDKTGQVIDTDARIANLESLRDRLRTLLLTKTSAMKDILEVERELANTQAQLDSAKGLRKSYADQTEKVQIQVTLNEITALPTSQPGQSTMSRAYQEVLASVSQVITTVAKLIPWAVFAGLCWAIFAFVRYSLNKKTKPKQEEGV